VVIQADYANAIGGGEQAFHSDSRQNGVGYYSWTIEKEWMKGLYSNNVTLYFHQVNPASGDPIRIPGPTIMVTNRPPTYYRHEPTKVLRGRDLAIALPTLLAAVLLCVCGVSIFNRKHRSIGLGNVMGRRKGYGTGKSRVERLGLLKQKAAAVQLRELQVASAEHYKDVDNQARDQGHARADSDALGSLAGAPVQERTNYFRDEMKKQQHSRV